jgi:ribonuclease HII
MASMMLFCHSMLLPFLQSELIEAGCDEAGRGCLAGPVYAAAVILPKDFSNELLNDSKQLSEANRYALREVIEKEALAYAVAKVSHTEIDKINILQASIRAMHLALQKLKIAPEFIIIDGNRFIKYKNIPHQTIIKGDGQYASIAAASILAKTYRDDEMLKLHKKYPQYNWASNKGYGSAEHRAAMAEYGRCPLHRKSFVLKSEIKLQELF